MNLSEAEARQRLRNARVLRLATVDAEGTPHQVPATFATRGDDTLVTAVDLKPKRHTNLRRLRNIRENRRVCALVDEYSDDWTQLWWVRADGFARILDGVDREAPLESLAAKYPQYERDRPDGPVIEITVTRVTGWASKRP
ncbi:TIGR03668 family PPOX class F420-dependent oxidoreductase [Streptomyces sp. WMMC500]|uniref:TIGR03668 family PPOX class F420-dependent oxidoreductase n=1 Tax=Streptomyces sp. WMMC500 TaxID=3015154 RepID=UPI00248BA395|nr:TIGR03668 family PPOX class F420-dependent oxidoreductase [Streptomyces sp. WMMC500]WBB63037.1 TIGR03668 family PPOX class F420-dependent oxidoreductase [Streptomyces sp. WMMC500]